MHADRTNRFVLTLFALLLIAGGTAGALAGFGVFGEATQHGRLLANRVGRYFGAHGMWLWPAIAAGAAIVGVLALRWLYLLLFSTDRAGDLKLGGDRTAGRTTVVPAALTDAVSDEIAGYPGVHAARARVLGDSSSPSLAIAVTLEQSADLAALRSRIETNAAQHARVALDNPELPILIDLTVTDRRASRVS